MRRARLPARQEHARQTEPRRHLLIGVRLPLEHAAKRQLGVGAPAEPLVQLAERLQRQNAGDPQGRPLETNASGVEIAAQEQRAPQQRLCLGVVGQRRHRLTQLAHRFVVPVRRQIDGAEATIDFTAQRVVAEPLIERRPIGVGRRVQITAPTINFAERHVRLAKSAAHRRRSRKRLDGASVVAAARVGDAEQIGRARMLGTQLGGQRQLVDRRRQIAALQVGRSQFDVLAHVVGNDQVAELVGELVESVEDAHSRSLS